MPITTPEFQTFYVVTKLVDSLFPNGKLYVARQKDDDGNLVDYGAGIVEREYTDRGALEEWLLRDLEWGKTRIDALNAMLVSLEDLADKRLDKVNHSIEDDDNKFTDSETEQIIEMDKKTGREPAGKKPLSTTKQPIKKIGG